MVGGGICICVTQWLSYAPLAGEILLRFIALTDATGGLVLLVDASQHERASGGRHRTHFQLGNALQAGSLGFGELGHDWRFIPFGA